MSRIESLRDMIEMTKGMTQSTRQHPIVIASPAPIPNANNAVRAILGAPLLLRNNDGSYVRDERGYLMLDHLSTYKANRPVAPANYSLDDVKFSDYIKALSDIPVSETPFRRIRLHPRRQSAYEMAIWGGFQWGGRTPAAATEFALRQAIRATFPKVLPRRRCPRRTLDFRGKSLSTGNLCKEYFHLWPNSYYGLTKQQRKLQEIIDAKFHADHIRLSDEFAQTYSHLPADGRFAMSLDSYAWACKSLPRSLHNSTGHWD